MGQIRLTVSIIMATLFSIAILGFAINFSNINNSSVNIANDSQISSLYSKNIENISTFSTGGEKTYQSIVNSTIEPGSQTIESAAPFAITPTSVFSSLKNIIEVGYYKIFGSGNGFGIFLFTFMGLLTFIMGLYLYKTLRGNPD